MKSSRLRCKNEKEKKLKADVIPKKKIALKFMIKIKIYKFHEFTVH